jgi:hypothetical protein
LAWHAICTVLSRRRTSPVGLIARQEDQTMNVVAHQTSRRLEPASSACFVMRVAGADCTVRATTVWPIHEVLAVEAEMLLAAGDQDGGDDMLVDLLDSRMIAPHRPRRRRERAVSSRAMFYAGADD